MPNTLNNPPLIEVIAELRWGKITNDPNDSSSQILEFTDDDKEIFPGQFKVEAEKRGFNHFERLNTGLPDIPPHMVRYRFRKEEARWPCYQIGLGIFTANHVREGYKWSDFIKAIKQGLEILDNSHPSGLEGLMIFGIELRYQNGFLLGDMKAIEFLTNAFDTQLGFLRKDLLDNKKLVSEPKGIKVGFDIKTILPPAIMYFNITQAKINGISGFVTDTKIRAMGEDLPPMEMGSLVKWFNESHNTHWHTFTNILNPDFFNKNIT